MWNPSFELLFLGQTRGLIVPFVEEIELAQIVLSCHFALDLHCYKKGDHLRDATLGTIACGAYLFYDATLNTRWK